MKKFKVNLIRIILLVIILHKKVHKMKILNIPIHQKLDIVLMLILKQLTNGIPILV